jgi:hypothetical protein
MKLSAEVLIDRINKGVLLDCDKILNSQYIKQFERDTLAEAADRAKAWYCADVFGAATLALLITAIMDKGKE